MDHKMDFESAYDEFKAMVGNNEASHTATVTALNAYRSDLHQQSSNSLD